MGRTLNGVMMTTAALALSACLGGQSLTGGADDAISDAPVAGGTTRLVERDVEAPKVFSASDMGLWDGRPSLGGVWVAYPGVKDPERVIIRNPANGKFVIGALFRREREMPGPKMQISSDAAAALGLLAGQPAKLDVTALRREEVADPRATPAAPVLDTAENIATETLAPAAGAKPAVAPAAAPSAAAPKPAAAPAASAPRAAAPAAAPAATGGRNLIQIGIFSVEANAKGAVDQLKRAGAEAQLKREESQGKTFWRVVAGPARDAASREALMGKVKGLGFKDAYFVSR